MPTVSHRSLGDLPKAHLHVHLEGAMRRATLRDLSVRYGTSVPAIAKRYSSFADFQELYVAACSVLQSPDDLSRLVAELVEDAAQDGAVWIEVAAHPRGNGGFGSRAAEMSCLIDAGSEASKTTGVGVGWIVTADRTRSPDDAIELAHLAVSLVDVGVVAFGLANDEAAAPPDTFERAFAITNEAGLLSVPHAGEHGGPESVLGAVDILGANRIEHGVRAIEDSGLVARLANDQVCLDVCPTSNVMLSVIPAMGEHPLHDLLAAGVPCTINADDPLLFGVGLLDEYKLCRSQLGFDDATLAACARSSIEHSRAPHERKGEAIIGIDLWVNGL